MVHLAHHDFKSAPASPTLDHFHRNRWTNSPEYAHCLTIGLIYAALSALLCWLVLRRGAMLSNVAAGAIGGGLAGFVGIVGLEILCPSPNLAHILLWHLSVAALGVMSGWTFRMVARSLRR
jgi:hypothetical protein